MRHFFSLPRGALFLLLAALLPAVAPNAEAGANRIHGLGTQPGSGIDIEVHALFERLPAHGVAPVRVTISNRSGREQTWRFSFTSSSRDQRNEHLTHEAILTVAQGEARKFDILVPLVRSTRSGWLVAEVHGPGILPGERSFSLSGAFLPRGHGSPPGIAISPFLSYANMSKLDGGSGRGHGGGINVTPFDLALLTPDWRAFAGFDAVWMADVEWQSTGPAERLALLDWVAAGGRLYICREPDAGTPLPGLRGLSPENPLSRGFGTIRSWPRQGDDLPIDETRAEMVSRIQSKQEILENSYGRTSWGLLAQLPEVRIRKGLFIGFLLLFALAVGPINLFLFARGAHRYRLFWTTPAISFGASLLIFILILVQDGVGGTGHQLSVWSHLPDENKAAVMQEQASRTALLTRRGFSIEEPVILSRLNLQTVGSLGSASMVAGHRTFGGDWFRNRATQGHLVEAVVATRWRIEAAGPAGGETPALLSTFPFALDSVYYLAPDGTWWHAGNVQAGQTRPLQRSDRSSFLQAWNAEVAAGGALVQRRARELREKPGHFYAFASQSPEGTWTTLESITWKTRRSLHTGPLSEPQP